MPRKLQIKLDGAGRGSVTLDGTDLSTSVRAVELRAEAGEPAFVTLELALDEIDVTRLASAEAEVLVNLPDDMIRVLTVLGWTPPEEIQRSYRMAVTRWVPADQLDGSESVNRTLPAGCQCFELDHHLQYFESGTHDERCQLFVTDNASPDAND